jgi:hypothetical protein
MKKAIVFLSSPSEVSHLRILYSAVTVRKKISERDAAVFAFVENEKTAKILEKIGVKSLQTGELYSFEQCNFNGSRNLDEMNFFFGAHEYDCIFLKDNTFALKNFLELFSPLSQRAFLLYEKKSVFGKPQKIHAKCAEHLVSKGVSVYDDTFIKVSPERDLWSSEVIGVPFLGKNALEKTKKMACRLSRKIKHEVFEPSLSFMIAEHGKVFPAKDFFGNFADFPEFDEVLKDFAARLEHADREEIFALAEKIDVEKLRLPKLTFLEKNYFEKTWLKLNKKHWQKPIYSFD